MINLREDRRPKTFLICKVRDVSPEEYAIQKEIVEKLEEDGWAVHWPLRDTNQNDETGYNICLDNYSAINSADVVHIAWNGDSVGSHFDLGVAFALGKPLKPLMLPESTKGKSFVNMLREWEKVTRALYDKFAKVKSVAKV